MNRFLITARTATTSITFSALAHTSSDAAILTTELLAEVLDGRPCGITVRSGGNHGDR